MTKSNTVSRKRQASPQSFPVIEIKGARSNNLKNLDVKLPKNQLIVVTGVSGSGKSSLIIDTLYAEGQRRYVESLSAYARQFLNRMKKPDVDYIKGLCPAIAIEQRVISANARSTVGSLTEIYDYMRLLFAKVGRTFSPITGEEVRKHEVSDIVDAIFEQPAQTELRITFHPPAAFQSKNLGQYLDYILQKGFTRLSRKSALINIEELLTDKSWKDKTKTLTSPQAQDYLVLVDRLMLPSDPDEEFRKRIADSVQTALSEGAGECTILSGNEIEKTFSVRFESEGINFIEPSPALFNYNNSFGACPHCEGYGRTIGIDENKVIGDKSRSVYDGAISCWKDPEERAEYLQPLLQMAGEIKFPIHKPYNDLNESEKDVLWNGKAKYQGIYAYFQSLEKAFYKIQNRIKLARYRGRTTCHVCKGMRLRIEANYVRVAGKRFGDLMFIPVDELMEFFRNIQITDQERSIASRILMEIDFRLEVLSKIGLSYLHLDRLASTLSGGESQRIHLTRTLGSNLSSSMYILDEPSIGLHPKDTSLLVEAILGLRNMGNTVIVIEHEEEVIRKADYILDIGPHAGIHGGEICFSGSYPDFLKAKSNLTADYLTGKNQIQLPGRRRQAIDFIQLEKVWLHNLQDVSVKFPVHAFSCVSGVSGSGKTSLIKHVLYPLLQNVVEDTVRDEHLSGIILDGALRKIKAIELVGQQGIGRSSRSNPATYVKAFDEIRDIFKNQQLSKIRNYQPRHFSFNVEGGRCEQCKGDGEIVVEMQFLADVVLPCEDCGGKRFKNEILEVRYKEKNISEVLQFSVEEALDFFSDKKDIVNKLKPLVDIGLGYLKLGQSSSTLSGGEAQRLKLAYYLGLENNSQHVFFIFDEPTTGLHFEDIKKLLVALQALVEKGHTVVVIEHNPEVLKCADWLVDLGPGGGKHGGKVIFQGSPEGILSLKESATAKYLAPKFQS
ncbi:MAG: excinuclease ABC subunit UvrA [Saprospiraceae bacterium]|nr:excinuclease ABC subunit UvrA [Saprospiraceae bacterium]